MHAGGRLLATSQQGGQGVHVHSAVLMQHRELQRGHSPRTVSRLAQRSECSSWLQECKQLQESMRKCVIVPPASCSLLLSSSHRFWGPQQLSAAHILRAAAKSLPVLMRGGEGSRKQETPSHIFACSHAAACTPAAMSCIYSTVPAARRCEVNGRSHLLRAAARV